MNTMHDYAARYEVVRRELDEAAAELRLAGARHLRAAAAVGGIETELKKCVGANIPKKLFAVADGKFVLVEHTHDTQAIITVIEAERP